MRVEAGGILASVMAWWQSRHRKTAHERRQQRFRAEARTASRLLRAFQEVQGHRGGQLSKLGMALQAALAGTESAPIHAEDREEAEAHGIPQERISERIMEQTIDLPVPQETKATETVCAEPAPAVARRRRTGKIVAPTPAVSHAAPAPLIEYAASEPAVTDTAAVPVSEHVAPAPGVTSATRAPAPVTKYALTCPAASSSADLSGVAASVAAARAREEALLAELSQRHTSHVQRPTSNVQCPMSYVRTSNIKPPTSKVTSPTSHVPRPTSNVQRPTTSNNVQQRPTTSQRPNVQRPTSERPANNGRL